MNLFFSLHDGDLTYSRKPSADSMILDRGEWDFSLLNFFLNVSQDVKHRLTIKLEHETVVGDAYYDRFGNKFIGLSDLILAE